MLSLKTFIIHVSSLNRHVYMRGIQNYYCLKFFLQALSQTEWITVYKIYPSVGSRVHYTINIIDTPGFADTRGIIRDQKIEDQIKTLFTEENDKGMLFIDAVCFIAKAPDSRLNEAQKYVFRTVMSLFGKDIESNICTFITFADGSNPPVLAALHESKFTFGQHFIFNNSGFFDSKTETTPTFWKMGINSFEMFFEHIGKLEARSISQTKDVLQTRGKLKVMTFSIRKQIETGLSKLSELAQEKQMLNKYKEEIKKNEDFEYSIDEVKMTKISLALGCYAVNCLQCKVSCLENHEINTLQRFCTETGLCTICPGNCNLSLHKQETSIIRYITIPVKKTYAEMKAKYDNAHGCKITLENCIEEKEEETRKLYEDTCQMMSTLASCLEKLSKIALKHDPLSESEYVELMIESEKKEKQPGYEERIQALKNISEIWNLPNRFNQFNTTLNEQICSP